MRTFGLRRAAERDWQLLSPATRALLTAYADGVNAYLAPTAAGCRSSSASSGSSPGPGPRSIRWPGASDGPQPRASTTASRHARAHLVAKVGEPAARAGSCPLPATRGTVLIARRGRRVRARDPLSGAARGPPPRLPPRRPGDRAWGSNGWVVHGSRTASGKPLLANDTHLGLSMPSVWYQNGLHARRLRRGGFSFPGMPLPHRPQPADRLGHHQHVRRRAGPLHREARRPEEPAALPVPGRLAGPRARREEIAVKGGQKVVLEVRGDPSRPDRQRRVAGLKGSRRWRCAGRPGRRPADRLPGGAQPGRGLAVLPRGAGGLGAPHPQLRLRRRRRPHRLSVDRPHPHPRRRPPGAGAGARAGTADSEWQGFIPFEEMPSLLDPPRASSSPPTTRWWRTTIPTSWPMTWPTPTAGAPRRLLAAGRAHPRGPGCRPTPTPCRRRPCAPTCCAPRRRESGAPGPGDAARLEPAQRRGGARRLALFQVWYRPCCATP